MFLVESPQFEKEKHPKLFQICSCGILFQGTQKGVRNSQGKRAISVRAIEVPPPNHGEVEIEKLYQNLCRVIMIAFHKV